MKFTSLILATLVALPSLAGSTKYNSKSGFFIGGYDPVSYITQNKAVRGKQEISHTYDGVKILFSSTENKKKFIEKPKKMLPAYKGWCAYAMSEYGELVKIDPKIFKIINGKTYLFYNKGFTNTLKKWNKKADNPQVKQANNNWKKKFTQ